MDQHDGGYGYPPYEEDPRAAGQGSGAPRGYRDDPAAYGVDPSQQYDPNATYDPAYANRVGYDERGYAVQPPQGGYANADNPYAPHPIDPNYGYSYPQENVYGNQQEYYTQQPPVGNYGQPPAATYAQQPPVDPYQGQSAGRYPENPDSAYATRLQMTDYSQRGSTARNVIPPEEDGAYYAERGTTGRTSMPRETEGYGYSARSSTARTRMPEDVEEFTPRGQTSRTRMPQNEGDYAPRSASTRSRYPQGDDRYSNDADEDDEAYERPRSSGKKKRTKFGKFMHALGLYLAQLPSQTLIIIGGVFVVLVTAVILIAVLVPKSDRTEPINNGQLGISDVTITPSLAPTDTPAPTEEVSPTPAIQPLTENIAKSGAVSDLLPAIQERLVELGYMDKPAEGYTTKFGPSTKAAIRLFQLKNFTDPHAWDGIIGNGTYTLLMGDTAVAYFLSRGDGDDRTKVITKLVEDVTNLQKRLIELGYLTGSATGLYGNTTVQAVKVFQEYHGLPIDGIAGQETTKLIYSAEAMTAEVGKVNNKTKTTATPSGSAATTTTTPNPNTSPSVSP